MKKFASRPHEYLIEQVAFTGDENVTISSSSRAQQIRLSFNHPTKLLAWVIADPATHGKFTGGFAGATQEALAPVLNAKLMLNGHDRADVRVGSVYNKIVPYQANKANPDAGIYAMSFALSPTQHAPSGSLNLSRIDSAVLALTFKAASVAGNTTTLSNVANVLDAETTTITDATNLTALRVFAVNYNVLDTLGTKSCVQRLSGYGAGNHLRVRASRRMPAASQLKTLARSLAFKNLLKRPLSTRRAKAVGGEEKRTSVWLQDGSMTVSSETRNGQLVVLLPTVRYRKAPRQVRRD